MKDAKKPTGNWFDDWQREAEVKEAEAKQEKVLDESSLFEDAMQDVKPIQSDNKASLKPAQKNIKIRTHEETFNINDVFSDASVEDCPEHLLYSRSGITPDTLKKLRQGKFPIDNSIDLHGMTVDAARQYLIELLSECEANGSRCIIIVHGKGYSSPDKKPVIKPLVNRWLREVPNVLAFCSALPKDGGTGAVYVLLKRNR